MRHNELAAGERVSTGAQEAPAGGSPVEPNHGRLRPLGLGEVRIVGGPWARRQEVNGGATLPHIQHWLEREGWLGNFDAAREGRLPGARRGREFSDSEVYKLLEAMAWEIGRTGDQGLEGRFRAIVARVSAVQEPDGYLNTNFGRPGQAARYSDLEWGHELYSIGHLIQAGVARARMHGDDELVTVARRAADHVCETFGPSGIASVCGHPEIELALVELYRVTGERRYLRQAKLFVGRRGHQVLEDIEYGRSYFQDDVPVREAPVLRGHAVRAAYLASGAVDVAQETGDDELLAAVGRQWRATVARRTYVTGGMGSRHQDEAFGEDFALPPDRAYSETCAGIASIMLSWRLLLARGSADFADLIERTLFNVVATSTSTDGTRFFYTNTLHQRALGTVPHPDRPMVRAASTMRAPWFQVSCCPTNVARMLASLGAYLATVDADGLQIHQYAPAEIRATLVDGSPVAVDIETDYPRSGAIVVRVVAGPGRPWTISLRVPRWATGAMLTVDGKSRPVDPGLVETAGDFRGGDRVVLELPMAPRFTWPDPRVEAVRGCVAVERGPEVLCLESIDVPAVGHVDLLRVDARVPPVEREGRVFVRGHAVEHRDREWPYGEGHPGVTAGPPADIPLIPYHDWAGRGPSTMRVWLAATAWP